MLVAVFLAVMFTQTGFIGHDAGHRQISGSKRADGLIGRIHGNLPIGLSYRWWVSKHNRHHAHPNQIGRDPDIGGRAISYTPGQIQARHRLGRYQAWLFFPTLLLEGLHLHIASVRALLGRSGKARWAEAGLLAVHIGGYLTAVFVVLSPLAGGGVPRCPAGPVRGLHGILVRPQPQRHARCGPGREGRFPARPGPHLTQHSRQLAHRPRPWRA
jgi:fatty acid desaturase